MIYDILQAEVFCDAHQIRFFCWSGDPAGGAHGTSPDTSRLGRGISPFHSPFPRRLVL